MKEKKLLEYEEKYKKDYERQTIEINQNSEEKLKNAEEKIKKDIVDKINKIKLEVSKEKNVFIEDINKKYEKLQMQ